MIYFSLINQFLYYSLGMIGIGGGYAALQKYRLKPDKLANNEIKGHKELEKIIGDDGLKISKNVRLNLKSDFEGCCLIGPTGSWKTTSLFLNNLLDNKIEGSFIVTDPKGELFELSSGFQKNVCGRNVYKIDLENVDYSEGYNMLEQCRNTEEVLQLASSLLLNGALSIEISSGKKVGGIEWIQMAEPLLSSVLLYVKELESPYNTIEFALQLILTLDNEQLKELLDSSKNIDAITQYNIFLMVGSADRTEGSIKITLTSNMKLFTNKDVNKISSYTTFNIDKFRKEPSILYIIYPERKSSYLAPFIAPFFSQITDKLLDNYSNKSLPIHLMFDEFGNIGMLNNMSINAATVRSRKINLTICLQSITQLYQNYGINNAKSILNNLKTKIILPGITDIDTINYTSNLCGFTEINTKSISYSKGNQSSSFGKTKRKIFEDGELRTLEDKTALIIINNKMPVIDPIEPYFECDIKFNVMKPVEYKRNTIKLLNIKKGIDMLRVINSKEYEDVSGRILRQIFNEKG